MNASIRKHGLLVAIGVSLLAPAAFAAGTHVYETNLSWPQLVTFDNAQLNAGRKIVDIEMGYKNGAMVYSGIWAEVPGAAVHGIVGVNGTDWQDFVNDMKLLDGRWLDVEVGYFGGVKRWSGIFVEDGDDYSAEVRSTMSEATFDSKLASNQWVGRQIIDFEAYLENGTTKYAAVWVDDPNQPKTAIYHHLTWAQVNDLINPQYPVDPASGLTPIGGVAGQIIDFDRYYSSEHGEYRYAIIVSNHPGNGLYLKAGPLSDLASDNATYTDSNTKLVDLDLYSANGTDYYLGVWADDVKSLNEVPRVTVDSDPQPIPASLQTLINNYNAGPSPGVQAGELGIFAINVRTNQSIAYQAGRDFYMASNSKVPMHILLQQMDEDGEIDLATDNMDFSTNNSNGNPWYVDNRDANGSFGPNDFGLNFTLDTIESYMLVQSDNAATSMLLEMQLGRGRMNRWMASQNGLGAGFSPITSITDLDRLIMWQGQVNVAPNAQSYWSIPSWVWEPYFRSSGTDTFGWLQNWVGNGNPFPTLNFSTGHVRYFRMGLNYAEPRAYGRLLERLVEGDFHDTQARTNANLAVFGSGTQMDDAIDGGVILPGMPPVPAGEQPSTRVKNGGKGYSNNGTRVVNDAGIFTKGADAIVMVIFSQGNSIGSTTFRNTYNPGLGYQLYANLISDLTDGGLASVSDDWVQHNETWSIVAPVLNDRPGDAPPYKVRFYASTDPAITTSDYELGTYQTPATHPGNTTANVGITLQDFPTLPPGSYYIGWMIDADDEVGEWDDRNSDNTVLLRDHDGQLRTIFVTKPQLPLNSNNDDSIDMLDLMAFQACFSGEGVILSRECAWANFDGDARMDADLDDYQILINCMTGPGEPIDPDCLTAVR